MADRIVAPLSLDLDDDTLTFLALAEPVVEQARKALGDKARSLQESYTLARTALAFLMLLDDSDDEIAKTRAINALGLALAGLEGEIERQAA